MSPATSREKTIWPSWNLEDGLASIARFVNTATLRGLPTTTLETIAVHKAPPDASDELKAEGIFRSLSALGVVYDREPYLERDGAQQVRHFGWLLEGVGNCLDLAVIYATLCLDQRIAPLILLGPNHAMCAAVIDPEGEMGARRGRSLEADLGDPRYVDGDWVYSLEDPGRILAAADRGELVLVDVVEVTSVGSDFARASASAADILRRGHGWRAVPIPLAQREGPPLHPAPTSRPAIRRFLPGGPGRGELFASQSNAFERLTESEGVFALVGEPGLGKSTVARRLVQNARHGAAWFLSAGGREVLSNSLASAALAELNRPGTIDASEAQGFAQSAILQLREVTDPWVVVIDNADGDPGDILRLIPQPGPGQLVVITSTNAQRWASHPLTRGRVIELDSVGGVEVREALEMAAGQPVPEELVELVDASPLLLTAYSRLLETMAPAEIVAATRPPGSGALSGADAYWAAVCAGSSRAPAEVELCALASLLPPDDLPVDAICRHGSRTEFEGFVRDGVFQWDEGAPTARLHRLVGAAIRAASDTDLLHESALRILNDPSLQASCEEFAERSEIDELARLAELGEPQAPSHRVGVALVAIGAMLEQRGAMDESASAFERALRHLTADDPDVTLLRARCHLGTARRANRVQKPSRAELIDASQIAEEGRRLAASVDLEASAPHLAMIGLLEKKLATLLDPSEQLSPLYGALERLEEAARLREGLPELSELRARSIFNLAGIGVDLAKLELRQAAEHLDRAEATYREVEELRRRIYRRDTHDGIAACIRGRALCDYYRALLLPLPADERSHRLRASASAAAEAVHQRERLEGPVDAAETSKANELVAKIALVRTLASPGIRLAETVGAFNAEYRQPSRLSSELSVLDSRSTDPREWIRSWVEMPELGWLVAAYGGQGEIVLGGEQRRPLSETLERLEEFSTVWDYRAGRERNLADADEPLPPAIEELVLRASAALGLRALSSPAPRHYDRILVLGGLARACLARPLYAAWLLGHGGISCDEVIAIGGHRPLGGDELDLASRLIPDTPTDEFDAMDAGMREAFGLGEPLATDGESSETLGASWRVRTYPRSEGAPGVRVVAAPSSEPGKRRANTADNYAWLPASGLLSEGQEILVVTTDIYVPFQHADAVRMLDLPHGVHTVPAGMRPGLVARDLAQVFRPHNYLQEIRSALRSLRLLERALPSD